MSISSTYMWAWQEVETCARTCSAPGRFSFSVRPQQWWHGLGDRALGANIPARQANVSPRLGPSPRAGFRRQLRCCRAAAAPRHPWQPNACCAGGCEPAARGPAPVGCALAAADVAAAAAVAAATEAAAEAVLDGLIMPDDLGVPRAERGVAGGLRGFAAPGAAAEAPRVTGWPPAAAGLSPPTPKPLPPPLSPPALGPGPGMGSATVPGLDGWPPAAGGAAAGARSRACCCQAGLGPGARCGCPGLVCTIAPSFELHR